MRLCLEMSVKRTTMTIHVSPELHHRIREAALEAKLKIEEYVEKVFAAKIKPSNKKKK